MQDIGDMRGMILRGEVISVSDAGGAQTVTVRTHDGFVHADVEVLQMFGVASHPPVDGAMALLLAVGADPAHLVALPIGNPARRFGAQAAGEAAVYAHNGSRVHIRADGAVEVWGAAEVRVHAATKVAITAPLVECSGDLHCAGNVSDSHGTLASLRGHYNAHHHGGSPTTDQPD